MRDRSKSSTDCCKDLLYLITLALTKVTHEHLKMIQLLIKTDKKLYKICKTFTMIFMR